MEISRWLKAQRTQAGLSQAQLAHRIGASQQLVGRWEAGNLPLHARWIRMLEMVLDLDGEAALELRRLQLAQYDGAA